MVASLQHGKYGSAKVLVVTSANLRVHTVRCFASTLTEACMEASSKTWKGEEVDSSARSL